MFQINKDTCIKWNYSDGDEFNDKKIDELKWQTRFPWSRSLISEDIFYSENNVIVDSGFARFRVQKEKTQTKLFIWEHDSATFKRLGKYPDSLGNYALSYTGGLIWSRKKYKYGYFEVRFKNPSNVGLWPAFWLYGENANEIDFMELKGEINNQIHVDIHCPDGCNNYIQGLFNYRKSFGHWIKTNGDFHNGFNVVSGEWQPNYVKYFLNGNLVAYFSGKIDVDLDLTTGNGKAHKGGAFAPGVSDKTIFPTDFIVDYIRVWSKDSAESIQKNLTRDFTIVDEKQSEQIEPKNERIKFKRKAKTKIEEIITLSVLPHKVNGYSMHLLGYNKKIESFTFKLISETGKILFEPTVYSNSYYDKAFEESTEKVYLEINYEGTVYKYQLK